VVATDCLVLGLLRRRIFALVSLMAALRPAGTVQQGEDGKLIGIGRFGLCTHSRLKYYGISVAGE
jgi:hypothetical protein